MTDIRDWEKQRYYVPEAVLLQIREIENNPSVQRLPEKVRTLRTNKLQLHKQGREAALFCYGLGRALSTKIYFANYEQSDYDFVACWKDQDSLAFASVQLKEVTPDSINTKSSLQEEINKLSKYSCSKDLAVAIFLNKRCKTDFSDIKIPILNIAELWIFGSISSDQSKWFIYGDMLKTPQFVEFDYPEGAELAKIDKTASSVANSDLYK